MGRKLDGRSEPFLKILTTSALAQTTGNSARSWHLWRNLSNSSLAPKLNNLICSITIPAGPPRRPPEEAFSVSSNSPK
eukprot:15482634-Alexandrium_andersonii.AAC.1